MTWCPFSFRDTESITVIDLWLLRWNPESAAPACCALHLGIFDISLKEDSGQGKTNLPTYTEMGVISWMLRGATQNFTGKIAVSLKPILGWFPLLFHLLPRYQQQWTGPPCSQSLGHCHRENFLYSIFVVKVMMIALVEASPSGKLRLLEKHTFFRHIPFSKDISCQDASAAAKCWCLNMPDRRSDA